MTIAQALNYNHYFFPIFNISVVALFASGIVFMLLYYKLFHVSKLGNHGDVDGDAALDPAASANNCRASLVTSQKSACSHGNQVLQ
jgi:hypothetical protein